LTQSIFTPSYSWADDGIDVAVIWHETSSHVPKRQMLRRAVADHDSGYGSYPFWGCAGVLVSVYLSVWLHACQSDLCELGYLIS
jgi:hypothetical protein